MTIKTVLVTRLTREQHAMSKQLREKVKKLRDVEVTAKIKSRKIGKKTGTGKGCSNLKAQK